MFIQIRGTFASGKTTTMRGIMNRLKQLGAKEEMLVVNKVEFAHKFSGIRGVSKPVVIVGRYNENACSGADSLSWKGVQEEIHAFVDEQTRKNHVILEGVMSHSGKYIDIAQKLKRKGVRVLFRDMATPLEECKERVMERRRKRMRQLGKKGEPKPLNPVSMTGHFNAVKTLHEKTLAAGLDCAWVKSEPKYFLRIIQQLKLGDD